jgi:IS4 transposase
MNATRAFDLAVAPRSSLAPTRGRRKAKARRHIPALLRRTGLALVQVSVRVLSKYGFGPFRTVTDDRKRNKRAKASDWPFSG